MNRLKIGTHEIWFENVTASKISKRNSQTAKYTIELEFNAYANREDTLNVSLNDYEKECLADYICKLLNESGDSRYV